MSAEGYVWSQRRLRAALWIIRILGPTGAPVSTARTSWSVLPVAGEVDIVEFEDALKGLVGSQLVSAEGECLIPAPRPYEIAISTSQIKEELLYAHILEECSPLWLRLATNDGDAEFVSTELIPESVTRGLESIMSDPSRREAFLLSRARRIDSDARIKLGDLAEAAAVEELRAQLEKLGASSLAATICRVSLISDELGYDVTAPRVDGSSRRIEVKGVQRTGSFVSVVVTANEMRVGRSDPDWYLFIVEVADTKARPVGWATAQVLEPLLPTNPHECGRWETARLKVPVDQIVAGLPPAVGSGS